jgi:hypothetical protein
METRTILIAILSVSTLVVILGALGLAFWVFTRKRHSQELREKFGPEYDYTLNRVGDQRKAEAELTMREKHIKELEIRELDPEERRRYLYEWDQVQAKFVDEPAEAVARADQLIQDVMNDRGFPVADADDFEQRTADFSVLYPEVVSNYRTAHDIAWRVEEDGVSTEELRQAMVYYRSMFNELLQMKEPVR